MNSKSLGFTLVEIMVASVILFAVLSTVSMVYRGAILSSTKAAEHLQINAQVQPLLEQIETQVRAMSSTNQENLTFEGQSNQVKFEVSASLIDFRAAPDRFNPDSGEYIELPLKYKLWRIHLQLSYNNTNKSFTFTQLGWLDA
ncbi:hypothetical protein PSECIP111854_01869 [Pseudoalteromonas sp. CIP111854]|uniref:Prepilin-type N-terminal cleavage/methylation domain-containing protein n=1 Tax=Pseudoalteromonas holothuriae TaxID=2963714 RepID=A0A9W4QWV7_9GAMM|nr:prepilin-type N-terminal cleavage/methylation domain-containing protein [Pseudoalteromonas sp. CIP111854]CAH9056812.1 hypothetical protein PSECIP111854_01869 [Pseudoalteromonas sp. CIP111854]